MEWTCNEVSPVLVVSLSMIYDLQELTLLLYFTVCSQRIYRNFEFVVCMSLLCREEYRTKELKKTSQSMYASLNSSSMYSQTSSTHYNLSFSISICIYTNPRYSDAHLSQFE